MRLLIFTTRTHRTAIVVWVLLLCALAVATGDAYESSYPSAEARHVAAESARENPALTAMYGRLAEPGTSAQYFAWEMGAFLTILAAVMGVLLAIAATRGPEDAGTLEILRASGISPAAPLRTSIVMLTLVALLTATATGGAIAVGTRGTEGTTQTGSWTLGGAIGLTFLLMALLTCVVAQVMPTAVAGRGTAFTLLGVAFLVRAVADTQDLPWLNVLTPLGLRALAEPFAADHLLPLVAAMAVCCVLAFIAPGLQGRRDLGAGLVPTRNRTTRRLQIRSAFGLQRRLGAGSALGWMAGMTLGGAVFTALGSSAVTATSEGQIEGGFLGTQIGTEDPTAGYLGYTGTLIGIVAGVYAVLTVLTLATDERAGRTAHLLAAGAPRARPLAAVLAVAMLGSLLILLPTATASALVAPQVLDGDHVAWKAFTQVLGQWPSLLALAAFAALAVAAGPRWRHLAWFPLAVSAFLALLGTLLELPERLIDLSVYQHVPASDSGQTPYALGVLAAMAVVTSAMSLRWFRWRDLANG